MNRSPSHLARRAASSLSRAQLSVTEIDRVREILLPAEMSLWLLQQSRDQRHSVAVWNRFVASYNHATIDEQRAALLHDLGKSMSNVGWLGRIVATLIGGRTKNLQKYLDHEHVGVEMLQGVSSARTLEILSGTASDSAALAIFAADDA